MPALLYSPKTIGVQSNLQPEYQGQPITPSDSVDVPSGPAQLNSPCCGFVVTGAGSVSVSLQTGVSASFAAVPASTIVDIGPIKRINATGTTASGVSALFASDPL